MGGQFPIGSGRAIWSTDGPLIGPETGEVHDKGPLQLDSCLNASLVAMALVGVSATKDRRFKGKMMAMLMF